jgi:hypothetical protein
MDRPVEGDKVRKARNGRGGVVGTLLYINGKYALVCAKVYGKTMKLPRYIADLEKVKGKEQT